MPHRLPTQDLHNPAVLRRPLDHLCEVSVSEVSVYVTLPADGLKSQNKPWPHPSANSPKMYLPGHFRVGLKKCSVTRATLTQFD